MTLEELKLLLEQSGLPVAYMVFKEETSLPFITYVVTNTNNFMADNTVYKTVTNIDVELYSDFKDLETEKKLETLFKENEIAWNADDIFIEEENMFQRVDEISIIDEV